MEKIDLEQLLKRVEALEKKDGGLDFPINNETKRALENAQLSIFHALVLKAGFDVYTSARDIVVDPPKEAEVWIEDVSSQKSLCFFRNNTKVCMPAATTPSATYNPVRSAEANMDANVTFASCKYIRVGNMVIVSGRFNADPTLTDTTTSFEMTLPVTSDLAAAGDVSGMAFCGNIVSMGAEVIGSAANNTAKVQWKSSDVTAQDWSFVFMYQVI